MSVSFVFLVALLPIACWAETWQISNYYTTGGCTTQLLYQAIVRIDDGSSCDPLACTSIPTASVSLCCSSTAPVPSSSQMAWVWRDGTDTCSGGSIVYQIFFALDVCVSFGGVFQKYVQTGDNVTQFSDCTDDACTQNCNVNVYQLGCNGFSLSNTSFSWEYAVGTGAGEGAQCDITSTTTTSSGSSTTTSTSSGASTSTSTSSGASTSASTSSSTGVIDVNNPSTAAAKAPLLALVLATLVAVVYAME